MSNGFTQITEKNDVVKRRVAKVHERWHAVDNCVKYERQKTYQLDNDGLAKIKTQHLYLRFISELDFCLAITKLWFFFKNKKIKCVQYQRDCCKSLQQWTQIKKCARIHGRRRQSACAWVCADFLIQYAIWHFDWNLNISRGRRNTFKTNKNENCLIASPLDSHCIKSNKNKVIFHHRFRFNRRNTRRGHFDVWRC